MTENGKPDRWDIVLGHWVFYCLWHGGQRTREYARLSRMSRYFRPGFRSLCLDNPDNEGAKEVYLALCRKHGVEQPEGEEMRA